MYVLCMNIRLLSLINGIIQDNHQSKSVPWHIIFPETQVPMGRLHCMGGLIIFGAVGSLYDIFAKKLLDKCQLNGGSSGFRNFPF